MRLALAFVAALALVCAVLAQEDLLAEEKGLGKILNEQNRIHRLAETVGKKSSTLQKQSLEMAHMQHRIAVEDHKLLQKVQKLRQQQKRNAELSHELHAQQLRVAERQRQLLTAQMHVQNMQAIVNTLASPDSAYLVPSPEVGVVANPELVNKLPSKSTEVGDKLVPGRYVMQGRVTVDGAGERSGPRVIAFLHADHSVSGTALYKDGDQDHADGLTVQLVGSWTSHSIRYAEVFNGKTYNFHAHFDAESKRLTGDFTFLPSGKGTFDFGVEELRIRADSGATVSGDYFKPHPTLDTPHEIFPVGKELSPGFFKLNGETENRESNKVTVSPTLLITLRSDGHMTGRTRFLANEEHGESVVRLAGAWNTTHINYAFVFHGKTYHFDGVFDGAHGLEGQYFYGSKGSGGSFRFTIDRVVFHAEDPVSQGPLTPAVPVPAGSVFDAYSGANKAVEKLRHDIDSLNVKATGPAHPKRKHKPKPKAPKSPENLLKEQMKQADGAVLDDSDEDDSEDQESSVETLAEKRQEEEAEEEAKNANEAEDVFGAQGRELGN